MQIDITMQSTISDEVLRYIQNNYEGDITTFWSHYYQSSIC